MLIEDRKEINWENIFSQKRRQAFPVTILPFLAVGSHIVAVAVPYNGMSQFMNEGY
jgi:hypothetical protein